MARATQPSAAASDLDEWRLAVEANLKGASFEKRLVTKTLDGIELQPLYSDRGAEDTAVPRRATRRWSRHEVLDVSASPDLAGAVDSAARRGIQGLRLASVTNETLGELRERTAGLALSLHPTEGATWEPNTIQASTLDLERRGAGATLQIAAALARGVAALRRDEASMRETCEKLEFEIALDTDLFLGIATVRALRLTWSKLIAALDENSLSQSVRIHARNSERFCTVRDPWVNVLRGTTSTFAAAVGGADSITTLPFDTAIGQTDESARRLSSNTQTLLEEESHLAAVLDPAAGSGYLEAATRDLAKQAWALFNELEQRGGLETAEGAAWVDSLISDRVEQEARVFATRRRAIVGVSEFPSLDEKREQRVPHKAPPAARRVAEPFERLRDRGEARGAIPRAFLANLGSPQEFRPRAAFAANFLAIAGIRCGENDGFEDMDSAARAFADSGVPLAVICSSDERYQECAAELATALKDRGALVLLAGKPGERRDAWTQAGVFDFVHLGSDALATLGRVLDALEVNA